jgi:hypothetical protein
MGAPRKAERRPVLGRVLVRAAASPVKNAVSSVARNGVNAVLAR